MLVTFLRKKDNSFKAKALKLTISKSFKHKAEKSTKKKIRNISNIS
jgi:hypothetical protein